MLTIKILCEDFYDLGNWLIEHTWSGAKDRVEDMDAREFETLVRYLLDTDMELTETELNDFIWFEWDDIYKDINYWDNV